MLHIRPVTPSQASERVNHIYEDIKQVFDIEIVPLVFQYIAGFEEYFVYVWDKIKQNMTSDYVNVNSGEVIQYARATMAEMYHPSREVSHFVTTLHPSEMTHLQDTIDKLALLNSKLFLLTLGMRENLKGVQIGIHLLSQNSEDWVEEEVFDQYMSYNIIRQNLNNEEKDVEPATRMLAPLFGPNSLMVSQYPSFFSVIAREMEELVKTESYLVSRVGIEQIGMFAVNSLPYPLGTTYQEIAQFAGKKPFFHELLYILSETFPTRFPRLVFTSAMMHQVLFPSTSLQTQ